jgi:hypothetical protein
MTSYNLMPNKFILTNCLWNQNCDVSAKKRLNEFCGGGFCWIGEICANTMRLVLLNDS